MPIFVASLIGGLVSVAGSLVGRVLLALGIGFVAFQGIDVAISGLLASVQINFGGLPGKVVGIAHALKVDIALTIIFSAITARLAIMGLTSGIVKKMVVK